MGHLLNSLVTIGMAYLFNYLLNLLCTNSSYMEFVEAGKAQSVYRLDIGPGGLGFESLHRQEVFPFFKTPIPALEST